MRRRIEISEAHRVYPGDIAFVRDKRVMREQGGWFGRVRVVSYDRVELDRRDGRYVYTLKVKPLRVWRFRTGELST